jgi:hypothetical protein
MRYSAWLVLDDNALHGCALSDISETGARIAVEDSETIPDRFILMLSGNGSAKRKCRVVWRTEKQIGVKFEMRLAAVDRASLVPHLEPFS